MIKDRISLMNLKRYEKAIYVYDKAIQLNT